MAPITVWLSLNRLLMQKEVSGQATLTLKRANISGKKRGSDSRIWSAG
jgi:hypothetical protein